LWQSFFLFGNPDDKKAPSVLNGFSKDVLAATWNVDEETVEKLLTAQKGAAIIKLEKHARAPAPNTWFGDFSFNLRETQPELVTRGGMLNFVTEYKMPILKEIGLSASVAGLEPVSAACVPGLSFVSAELNRTGRSDCFAPFGIRLINSGQ
jgi:hypothetical protein